MRSTTKLYKKTRQNISPQLVQFTALLQNRPPRKMLNKIPRTAQKTKGKRSILFVALSSELTQLEM